MHIVHHYQLVYYYWQFRTLYFSADTNAHTMAMRLVAMAGNMSQQNAEQLLKKDPDKAHELLLLNNHLFWSFESTPTLKDLDDEVSAFETVWGRSPTLIVVDNKGRVNWPDLQWRIYKRTPEIRWKNKVHEVLDGYKTHAILPLEEELALEHHKDIERQEKQNELYSKL